MNRVKIELYLEWEPWDDGVVSVKDLEDFKDYISDMVSRNLSYDHSGGSLEFSCATEIK